MPKRGAPGAMRKQMGFEAMKEAREGSKKDKSSKKPKPRFKKMAGY